MSQRIENGAAQPYVLPDDTYALADILSISIALKDGPNDPKGAGLVLNQDSIVNFVDFALLDGCCIEVINQ